MNADANSMRLHAKPPQVTRLSRKMLLTAGMFSSVIVGTALIYAFQTRVPDNETQELYSLDGRRMPDALQSLPKDYTGPILGKPLPGDLGRAMVEHETQINTVPDVLLDTDAIDTSAQEQQQRLQQEIETARLSTLFIATQTKSNGNGLIDNASTVPVSFPPLSDFVPATLTTNDHAARQRAFLDTSSGVKTVSDQRINLPASQKILQAGSIIPAALLTGIRSDLPGQITVQVTQNVYDSPTGRILLIPQGSRLIGQYDNAIAFGQSRVLFLWQRLIFPDGSSLTLENMPGTDVSGYAGVQDKVDYHWGALTKAAALSTLLSIGSELATDDSDTRLIRAIRDGAQDTVNSAGQKIIERQINIAPTLTIRSGFPVRVIITQDLIFETQTQQ